MKYFASSELQIIIQNAQKLRSVPAEELEKLVNEFEDLFTEGTGLMDNAKAMEDILEETLGKFRRKDPQQPVFERIGTGKWRVNGICTIDEFRREYPALRPLEEVDTVGGLLVKELEYVPAVRESALVNGLRLTATRVDDRRVRELEIEVVKR